jgi:3-hydroxybutyryl-CoA dehydratase
MTVYFDELKPGQTDSFTKQVSERDVELFGEVTGDMNPVHFDEAYARKTVFRGRVAHGAITVSYLSALLGTKMPGPGTIVLSLTTRFKAPVRPSRPYAPSVKSCRSAGSCSILSARWARPW